MDDQTQNYTEGQGTENGGGENGGSENGGGENGGQACAEIFAHDVWINNDGGDPVLKAGQPFTMMAQVCNQGPNSTGLFQAKFVLDSGADSTELQCPNLDPGQCVWISWSYPQGAAEGSHTFEAYFDIYHQVPCDDQSNNYTYYGFDLWSNSSADAEQTETTQEYA